MMFGISIAAVIAAWLLAYLGSDGLAFALIVVSIGLLAIAFACEARR